MTESKITGALRTVLQRELPGCEWTKHADRFTGGIPDASLVWGGHTSWLEFKLLGPTQTVHDELRADQLDKLIKLERQGGGHAWVICWVKKPKHTLIYRPTALQHGRVPGVESWWSFTEWPKPAQMLWDHGVITFDTFAHHDVVRLIRATHQ